MRDPLVPNREDVEVKVLWREGRPSHVASLFDEYLAASDRRCECGRMRYYVKHELIAGDPSIARILSRCNNGHEETIEIAGELSGLNQLSRPNDA